MGENKIENNANLEFPLDLIETHQFFLNGTCRNPDLVTLDEINDTAKNGKRIILPYNQNFGPFDELKGILKGSLCVLVCIVLMIAFYFFIESQSSESLSSLFSMQFFVVFGIFSLCPIWIFATYFKTKNVANSGFVDY